MIKNSSKFNRKSNKCSGFTLFIAMIVTGLVLGVGFSITNILLKELGLSSSGRESQIAFYAADSAAECAIYWDRKDASGATIGASPFAVAEVPVQSGPDNIKDIKCGTGFDSSSYGQIGYHDKTLYDPVNPENATSTFYISFVDPLVNSCGKVTVVKVNQKTKIDARGYNVGLNQNSAGYKCDISNPRTLERGLTITY